MEEKELWEGTDFLFPRPSVWYGLARLIDLGAMLDSYNDRETPEEADRIALYLDWLAVGKDFRVAIEDSVQSQSATQKHL